MRAGDLLEIGKLGSVGLYQRLIVDFLMYFQLEKINMAEALKSAE